MDKKYDDMTEEERNAFDKKEREREAAEQAELPYRWSQDLATVTVNVDLPKGTRGKDLNVVIEKRKLKVQTDSSSHMDRSDK
jgi:HSP20 family molecular chaperone IbpA